jgi:hypothetical protein
MIFTLFDGVLERVMSIENISDGYTLRTIFNILDAEGMWRLLMTLDDHQTSIKWSSRVKG